MINTLMFNTSVSIGKVMDKNYKSLFMIHQATMRETSRFLSVFERLPEPHLESIKAIELVNTVDDLKICLDAKGYSKPRPFRIDSTGTIKVIHEKVNEHFEEDFIQELGRVVLFRYLRPDERLTVGELLPEPSGLEPTLYESRPGAFIKAYEDYLFHAEALSRETPALYQWMRTYLFRGEDYNLPEEWIKPRPLAETLLPESDNGKTVNQSVPEQAPF